jgi:hypothetical protein
MSDGDSWTPAAEDDPAEDDDPVVVYRTGVLLDADIVAEAMRRAQIPHVRRMEMIGGWSVAMPANPGPGMLPGNFFAIAVPRHLVKQATHFVARLPVSREVPSSHRMPGVREMFQGWTWIFVLAILLVLILGVIRMYLL